VHTQHEAGDIVPGTPESAPAAPRLLRVFLVTTMLSALIFAGVAWLLTHRTEACTYILRYVAFDLCT
jgi:predicted secreted protein